MDADGNNRQKLTSTGLQSGMPDWSPDGTKIIFTVSQDTYSEEGDICMIGSDGTGFRILTDAGQGYGPVWSDDGSSIIFCSKRTGHFEIYLMASDGNNLQQMTSSQTDKLNARLSPDGQRIVYTLISTDGNDTGIHLMNTDGTGDITLTHPGQLSKNPCWSSDGKQIFFQTSRFGNHEIYQMDDDGRFQVNISRNTGGDYSPGIIRKATLSGLPGSGMIPGKTGLNRIFPNPADQSARIEFSLATAGHVDLLLADLLGRPVSRLLDEDKPAGDNQIQVSTAGLSPGIYMVILTSCREVSVRKMVRN
jgi:dipeptidyl aminopeptidase/acylaminoacyl peptidase